MKLKLLKFIENQGNPSEWGFAEFELQQRNLVVGINASGKSRTIRSIDILASLLSKRMSVSVCPTPLKWKADFQDEQGELFTYELEINNCAVVSERFAKSDAVLLDRPAGGVATIRMENGGKSVSEIKEFKIPDTEIAAPNKMDLIQTPFLVPLINWGESVFYYRFGTSLGQEMLGMKGFKQVNIEQIEHDQNSALPKFAIGMDRFPEQFSSALKNDMGRMGYAIAEANLLSPVHVINPPASLVSLSVKEVDLDSPTEQLAMSQGMYRAYSILIHANYLVLFKKCGCLMIDDIGEGLDFGRSGTLIDLLTEKSIEGGFQLLMTTNDRFIMNHVPLKEWTVILRSKGRAKIHNYANSKRHFDEFKFTGMNNFDFLATDFLNENIDDCISEGIENEKNGSIC